MTKLFGRRRTHPDRQRAPRFLLLLRAIILFSLGASVLAQSGYAVASPLVEQTINLKDAGRGIPNVVRFSPDGQWLAVGTRSGIVLYDDHSLAEVWFTPAGDTGELAFSPDGTILAAVFHDAKVRLFRIGDGSLLITLDNPGNITYYRPSIVYSPDGSLLASGDDSGGIRVWRTSDGSELYTLRKHEDGIVNLLFTHDSSTLVSVDGGQLATDRGPGKQVTVRFWRLSDGSLIRTVTAASYLYVGGLASDGKLLVAVGWDESTMRYTLDVWQVTDTDLTFVRTLDAREDGFDSNIGVVSQDEGLYVTALGNSNVGIWSVDGTGLIQYLSESGQGLTLVALSPDKQTVVAGSAFAGAIHVWSGQNAP